MTASVLSLIIDVFVLVGLGVTIFYAVRLSTALKNFRQGRAEFERLVQDLNHSIERAHNALAGLHKMTASSDTGVKEQMESAKRMVEELKAINVKSALLADRMEGLSVQSHEVIDQSNIKTALQDDSDDDLGDYNKRLYQSLAAVEARSQHDDAPPSFLTDEQDDEVSNIDNAGTQSQAEKDLQQAIEKNKRSMGQS